MHSVRSTKAAYFAAFLFGALIALLIAAPARSAETIPLFNTDPVSEVIIRSSGALQ